MTNDEGMTKLLLLLVLLLLLRRCEDGSGEMERWSNGVVS